MTAKLFRPMCTSYRFLAVDVDGTLVNSRGELPPANREALHRAHEAGMTVCICTGRSLAETRSVIGDIGLDLDAGVFVFGAIVSKLPEGLTVKRTGLSEPLATQLVEHFQSAGHPVLTLFDGTVAPVGWRMINGERNIDFYERWLTMAPEPIERLDAWAPADAEPVRIGIIVTADEIDAAIADLEKAFRPDQITFNSIYAPNYRMHVVECFAAPVNKWYGLMQVAAGLGIDGSQVMAIGDDVNDRQMIQQAGLSVAMGNAHDSIRRIAHWRAPTNDECGVAAAVNAVLSGDMNGLEVQTQP